MGSGDFIAQTIIEKRQIAKVDFMRTLKFLTIGFCVVVSSPHTYINIVFIRSIEMIEKSVN